MLYAIMIVENTYTKGEGACQENQVLYLLWVKRLEGGQLEKSCQIETIGHCGFVSASAAQKERC